MPVVLKPQSFFSSFKISKCLPYSVAQKILLDLNDYDRLKEVVVTYKNEIYELNNKVIYLNKESFDYKYIKRYKYHDTNICRRFKNNKYTRFFGRINENVERAVRLPMAIDSLRKGMDYDGAVARVTRYHFNYSDLSQLDEAAMRLVPFWIWTSRNIPLQVANMVTRPSAYLTYDKIQEAAPPDTNLFMPEWLASMKPIGLGGDKVLAFDLPFGRLEQSSKNIVSLEGLISQMTPAIKVPVETLVAGKQVGLGVPFTDKWEKAKGIDKAVAHLGEILGGNISRREDGQLMINPRWQYAINSMLPPVAKAERLSGGILGGKANYADRVVPSILNEFGIPYREVGPYEKGEAINRQFELKDFAKILERQGKIRKKD